MTHWPIRLATLQDINNNSQPSWAMQVSKVFGGRFDPINPQYSLLNFDDTAPVFLMNANNNAHMSVVKYYEPIKTLNWQWPQIWLKRIGTLHHQFCLKLIIKDFSHSIGNLTLWKLLRHSASWNLIFNVTPQYTNHSTVSILPVALFAMQSYWKHIPVGWDLYCIKLDHQTGKFANLKWPVMRC